jgi:hypothetical protein
MKISSVIITLIASVVHTIADDTIAFNATGIIIDHSGYLLAGFPV